MILRVSIFFIAFLLLFSCSENSEGVSSKGISVDEEIKENDSGLDENYFKIIIDSLNIGVKGNNKIRIEISSDSDSSQAVIFFYSKKNGVWMEKNKFILGSDNDLVSFSPYIQRFNSDDFNDLLIHSAIAARGSNSVMKLYVYDSVLDQLKYIKNSEKFPNLRYQKELDLIDSYAFHGSTTQYFLKIQSDTLFNYAKIERENDTLYSFYKRNNKGAFEIQRTVIEKEVGYSQFDNFE